MSRTLWRARACRLSVVARGGRSLIIVTPDESVSSVEWLAVSEPGAPVEHLPPSQWAFLWHAVPVRGGVQRPEAACGFAWSEPPVGPWDVVPAPRCQKCETIVQGIGPAIWEYPPQ
jgi:hypothetical protein